MIRRAWTILCVLWTALMVMVFFSGGEGNLGMIACVAILPWIVGFVVPFVWRYIVYGSPRRRYYY